MKKILFYSLLGWFLNFHNLKAQCDFNIDSVISDTGLYDYGNKVIQDSFGNYISCGPIFDQNNYKACYLVKAKFNGDTVWKKKFDFTTDVDVFNDIQILPDKSYIIIGTRSAIGMSRVFLTNIDTNGVQIWYKQFTYPEVENANAIQVTSDNKLIILGYSLNPSHIGGDILLIKTDLSGNLIWRKIIGSPTLDEKYTSLQIINNNTVYLIGGTERISGMYNIGVTKLDTSGNVIFHKINSNGGQDLYGNSICQTFDKGYLIGGKSNTQGRLWKLDSTGTIQWSSAYGLQSNTIINEVKQLADSNIVFISTDNYLHSLSTSVKAGVLAKIDKNGSLIWEKFYKRPSVGIHNAGFYGFSLTKDHGFIITGSVSNVGAPHSNLWLVKTDSVGNDSSNCLMYNGMVELNKSESGFEVYPNPSDGSFKLIINNLKENERLDIKLTDVLGKEVLNEKYKEEINISNLESGIYFLSLYRDKELVETKKIIKQ